MNIKNFLEQFSSARIYFEDTSLSYQEIAKLLYSVTPETFKWTGDWTSKNFIKFLSAFHAESPIICSPLNDENFPLIGKGEIAFRTSGTEGETKWIIHNSSVFLSTKVFQFERKAKALLSPAHAAGFDFMFHALRQGCDFTFSKLDTIREKFLPEVIFGPPQALGSLLFFQKKNQDIFTTLKTFFSSTDSLNSEIIHKCKKLDLKLKLRTFYGSSETMMIWNESHPDDPSKIKLSDGEGDIQDGNFSYTGNTLAKRQWVNGKETTLTTPYKLGDKFQIQDGWINLIENKRNIFKVWGHSLNLRDLENRILGLPNIAHVVIQGKNEALGTKIKITLFGEVLDETKIKSILPLEVMEKAIIEFELKDAAEIDLKKPKRIE